MADGQEKKRRSIAGALVVSGGVPDGGVQDGLGQHEVMSRKRKRAEAFLNEPPTRTRAQVELALAQVASPHLLSSRPGPRGDTVHYLAGHHSMALASEVFGFDGWTNACSNSRECGREVQGNSITVYWETTVCVCLADHLGGSSRTDVGHGKATDRSEFLAMQKASKESVTDGLKRALSLFGQVFACFKDKEYLTWAAAEKRRAGRRVFSTKPTASPSGQKLSDRMIDKEQVPPPGKSVEVYEDDFDDEVDM